MSFKNWLNEVEWSIPWPYRQGTGDNPREKDIPPELTAEKDYVLYHGTNIKNTRSIFKTKTLLHDDIGVIGISTTPSEAGVFAAMKTKHPNNPGTILRLVIDKNWLLQQEITREVGGSGRNQWLINVSKIPPHVIKQLDLYSVLGMPVGRFAKELNK